MREITFAVAINEATVQAMERDSRVFLMGVSAGDMKRVFGTTKGAHERFASRVFDTPCSENAITGIAVGAAIAGMRPVMVHHRNDFMLLSMDQIINHAAKWRYMSGGLASVPLTIRGIVGRGWGNGAQHTQSLHALFMHFPGLKVVAPATPYDAKGLLLASIEDDSPVIYIEHRWLHERVGPVPEEYYTVPLGRGAVRRPGRDVTLVGISHMVVEAESAADLLQREGVSAEVIDLRSLRPLDEELVLESVTKTGRLVVADTSYKRCGAAAEIAALVAERALSALKAPVRRVCLPDVPTPASWVLEGAFYPGAAQIVAAARWTLYGDEQAHDPAASGTGAQAGSSGLGTSGGPF